MCAIVAHTSLDMCAIAAHIEARHPRLGAAGTAPLCVVSSRRLEGGASEITRY